jgi:hypothetical protein
MHPNKYSTRRLGHLGCGLIRLLSSPTRNSSSQLPVNELAKPAYISYMDAAIHALAFVLMAISIACWITRRERARKPVHPRHKRKSWWDHTPRGAILTRRPEDPNSRLRHEDSPPRDDHRRPQRKYPRGWKEYRRAARDIQRLRRDAARDSDRKSSRQGEGPSTDTSAGGLL